MFVTGDPRPSGQSADFNLKLFDYCVLASADSIINCGSERLVPMFSPETTVGNRAFRVGAQSWLSHGPSEQGKSRFLKKDDFLKVFEKTSVFSTIFRFFEIIQ